MGIPARVEIAVDITEKETLNAVLSRIGEYYQAVCTYLLELNPERTAGSNTFEWYAPGVPPIMDFNQDIPLSTVPLWKESVRDVTTIMIHDIKEIKACYPIEYECMQCQNCRCVV